MFVSNLRRFVLALSLFSVLSVTAYANPQDAPTVHLIAVGDTDVGGAFGRKLGEDAENIATTFKDAFAKAGKSDQLKTRVMLGEEVTQKRILSAIAELEVRPNDTIVFLYSGHGEMTRDGHLLTLHHGDLAHKDVLAAMTAKKARLMVILTDCCSSGVPARPLVPLVEPRQLMTGETMEWNTVESLFLRHEGLVDITAAEPGYCGKIDLNKKGSLFTNALVNILKAPNADLIRNLDKDADGNMQWDEFLPQLRGLASRYDELQTREPGVRPQQAYATSLGRWMSR